MAGRTRTTKKLSQRINRDYFKNVFAIPHWRRLLSLVFVGLGIVWLGWHALARNSNPYSSGPITSSHAMFSLNCKACHSESAVWGTKVTDQSCQQCHDGPVHQAQQVSTPACTECHLEHKGMAELAHTSEKACTDCHSDLKTKDGKLKVEAHIASFSSGHPEFTPLRPGQTDPGTIKLNHAVHLKKGLRGVKGNVDMKCTDCHRPAADMQPWPYGKPGPPAKEPGPEKANEATMMPVSLTTAPSPHSRISGRAYMNPVNYFEACSGCHPLIFDKRITEPAPHKKPEVVHDFVVKKFEEYIAAHPEDVHKPNDLEGRIPTRIPAPPARDAKEWVQFRVAEAEELLWRKTCKECHSLQFPDQTSLPKVPEAKMNARWMQHGEFDHPSHQMLKCEECHTKAPTSKETSDILIPGVKVCQECHRPGNQAVAQAGCFECHQYHDWKQEKHIEGKYTVHQLMTGVVSKPEAPATTTP